MLMFTKYRPLVQMQSIVRKISTSKQLRSEELFVHRDSPDNNADTPFDFSQANMTRLCALIKNYPEGAQRSAIGAALDMVQRQIGWVPISAMHKVAEVLSMPRMRVYEFATFYTMYKRRFRGKFNVKVCVTTPCMIRGSDMILEAVIDATNCHLGEVSEDGLFGVDIVQCQGACANAPVVVVEDDYYEDLTIENICEIIRVLKCGGIPQPGPQSGRFVAEPICGPTSLLIPPPCPGYKLQPALANSVCCQDPLSIPDTSLAAKIRDTNFAEQKILSLRKHFITWVGPKRRPRRSLDEAQTEYRNNNLLLEFPCD